MPLAQLQTEPKSVPDIIAIGGGKGGVGKSSLAVNLSVELSCRGWRTVVVDADLGCSNVETLLGMRPGVPLDDYFFEDTVESLSELLSETPYANLRMLPGTSGLLEATDPGFEHMSRFHEEIQNIDAEVVIIDLDAGTRRTTLDLFLMGSNRLVVVTPEKTSIDNAFKFVRAALYRQIESLYRSPEIHRLLRVNESLSGFLDDLRESPKFTASLKLRIVQEIETLATSLHPRIVVNRARTPYEGMVTANILSKYIRTHLLVEPETVGHLLFDKRIPDAVNSGQPFIVKYPRHQVSQNVSTIGNRLGYL